MLYEKGQYVLLDEHLRRLTASAAHFDFHVDRRAIEEELDAQPLSPNERYRVRLLVDHSGLITVQCSELRPLQNVRLKLATEPVDSTDIFLFHKTTNRATYQHALAALDDCDDVLLWNEKREITESCLANVAFRIDDQWYTPPVKCGLLGGLFRSEMISSGRLHERVITLEDLDHVQEIQLMNSVRGIIPIETFTR